MGSPAYAGIDQQLAELVSARDRFPRIRGDRPDFTRLLFLAYEVPPHTRG